MTKSPLAKSHPSYLALDRASLGPITPELSAHLERCAECRRYVASLAEPPSASSFADLRQRVRAERRNRRRRLLVLAPGLAVAAAALLFFKMRPQPVVPLTPHAAPTYIGAKGVTSVWIYVKHGNVAELWDGKRAIFAGDRLRLKLDPGRFRRVGVYSIQSSDEPELLYTGRVAPGESTTLPDAWEVDAEPGAERLLVVFSDEAVAPTWPDWLHGKTPPNVAVLPFVLPKSSSPESDAGSRTPR